MLKHLHLLCTLVFGLAVLLFFGLAYPHHLHYQEQFQLFLFDSTYVWEIVRVPGGVADLLGRFSTQFFLYAWVGALIIAVLLSAVQLLTLRLIAPEPAHSTVPELVEGFVPAFLLWLFLLDENALMGGVWAVLLTQLAVWGYVLLPKGWIGRIVDWQPLLSLPDGNALAALCGMAVGTCHSASGSCFPKVDQLFEELCRDCLLFRPRICHHGHARLEECQLQGGEGDAI